MGIASISPELFEAELFGHRKGSFTGASSSRMGLCGAAASGTLFLDEVEGCPLPLPARLLRLLEQREYDRSEQIRQSRLPVESSPLPMLTWKMLCKVVFPRRPVLPDLNTKTLYVPPLERES